MNVAVTIQRLPSGEAVSRVARHGDITVVYRLDPHSSAPFIVRGLGGRNVRLGASCDEAHRALTRECGLTRAEATRLIDAVQEVES
ncbi:hypothetical protein HNR23_001724 [Nocardiopsis mwathae]|uniref:Uncharacterized protein n=1 Tax=Nocardiopsis mwathae TaxID=1472723 RepID=A0A7X0D618_9ACTN|nr:hypothetical protein [Nocardiopsis mwathae]MBB6171664.1 hypothetical protein [Nocardiopsis mwathae]